MAKLDPIENLAREICWAEFSKPYRKTVSCSKADYWKSVSELKKADYVRDAKFLTNILPRLPRQVVARLAVNAIQRTVFLVNHKQH